MREERGAAASRRIIAVELWRLVVPVLWFGMVAAISFIEAPLKFQAPGITIPLGLGIGRLVFAALNLSELVLLITLIVLSFWPRASRIEGSRWRWLLVLGSLFLCKIAVVRPPLNARTDLVLAGATPGQSPWHYLYIACDVLTMLLLVVLAVQAARAVLAEATSVPVQAPRAPSA